jgi:ApbE superfamily uncharacterized protein (UPF0280 family)
MYEPRTYRYLITEKDLVSFDATIKETDLYIRAHTNLQAEALLAIETCRAPLEEYITKHPLFYSSLEPYEVEDNAPPIVRDMAEAARIAGVGPMAAVAGAIAEAVGNYLLRFSPEVIVENGGDIYIKSLKQRRVGIYAGNSPFTGKLALKISPEDTPIGICTSSGTVGHSLSLGEADAVIVMSLSTPLADALATAIGNRIKRSEDIDTELKEAQESEGITGLVIIKGDRIGFWGNVTIVSTETGESG